MNKFRFTIKILVIATFMFAFASLAQAQATRTWVSGVGDDVNPCSRTAPCKTWAGAISKTAPCGEIDALDPGGFGAVTITKSLTLDGTGTLASILGSSTSAITINVAATDFVTIRGLTINGAGSSCSFGVNGINVVNTGPKDVNVEDCVIHHFTNGISFNVTGNSALNVRNTVLRDNNGDGVNLTSTGSLKADFVDCSMNSNAGNGLHARTGSRVTARNCVFSNNSSNGVFVDGATAGFSSVLIWASQISLNGGNGIQVGNAGNTGTSGLAIAQNQIDRNTSFGVTTGTGGVVSTFSNNSILGNGTDGCAGCTPVGPGS
jgi:Right handed beta helix region